MRTRVAVINTHPIQHFAPLWREMAKSPDIELKVLFCTDWGVKEYEDPGFGATFKWDVDLTGGYDSEFLHLDRRPKSLGFWETDNRDVGHALDRFVPEVLILFGYAVATNWRALAWARRKGVRVLVFSDSELKHSRSLRTRLAKQVVVRTFLSQVDGALPIGNCNADYYQHYGLPESALLWCAYPVDGERFISSIGDRQTTRRNLRAEVGISTDDFVFATVGKFIARKRHQDVIRAFMNLPSPMRTRARVLVVGEGPQRTELEALRSAAESRVHLTGFVNQSRMPAYFAASDALVVASDLDAHPLVVTEALFAGLPVLASDRVGCIGPDDTVRDGQNGWVYRCGDIGALAVRMGMLLSEKETYRQFSAKALEIAQSQSTQCTAQMFIEAILKVRQFPRTRWVERLHRALHVGATR